jgi:mannose-6-phosphate isomerase
VTVRQLSPKTLEKVWGSTDTEPWYPHSNRKIGEVWFQAPEEPRLLVKFLFTAESLSVQVHPPDSAAGVGKTEMWHVLRADPGARLALGFERPINRDQARAAAISGEIESLLRWYTPQPGDTFFVPAGTVHAIGPGLALVEIQQSSDVTYRLYDYGRPRELHLEAALAVADLGTHPGPTALPVDCPYFHTDSIVVTSESNYRKGPNTELLICLEGEAPGQVWVVPADVDTFTLQPQRRARFLAVFAPPRDI